MTTPLRTEKLRDRNYLSLNRDSAVLYAGTDDERQLEPDEAIPTHLVPEDPKAWDSFLKCSGRQYTQMWGLQVAQGRENTADFNNETAHCSFAGEWGVVGDEGEQIFTIKGGSHHITLMGLVCSRGTDCDIELGSWSDQSLEPVHTLDLSGLRHVTGRTFTVVMGRVRSPLMAALGRSKDIILPPNARVLFWASIGEQCYWWLKRWAIAMGLIRSRYNQQT